MNQLGIGALSNDFDELFFQVEPMSPVYCSISIAVNYGTGDQHGRKERVIGGNPLSVCHRSEWFYCRPTEGSSLSKVRWEVTLEKRGLWGGGVRRSTG